MFERYDATPRSDKPPGNDDATARTFELISKQMKAERTWLFSNGLLTPTTLPVPVYPMQQTSRLVELAGSLQLFAFSLVIACKTLWIIERVERVFSSSTLSVIILSLDVLRICHLLFISQKPIHYRLPFIHF